MKINTIRLRATLGWLAILLPWIVALFTKSIPESISITFYDQRSVAAFMMILGACSFLLISYKGYTKLDDATLTVAGVFGLLICLFPCYNSAYDCVGTFQLNISLSNYIHNICAVIFFGLLSYNSIFLFTKGSENPTKKKKIRNIIYIACGIGMIASFAIMLLPYFKIQIWLMETLALFFFGISFLTKADIYPWLFCDTPYSD